MTAAPVGHHNALVRRGGGKYDAVLVKAVFSKRGDLLSARKADTERRQRERTGARMCFEVAQLVPEKPQRPNCYRGIHQAKQQAGTNQSQLRYQHQRECE